MSPAHRSPGSLLFIVPAVLLLAAAVGLRPGMRAVAQSLQKESIALRVKLDRFDYSRIPGHQLITDSPAGYAGTAEQVETPDFMQFVLRPTAAGVNDGQHDVYVLVTYYSNPNDQVPHTPEVCYRQAGDAIADLSTVEVEMPGLAPDHDRVTGRYLKVIQGRKELALVYVFYSNGEFYHDRERLRLAIGMPGDKYTYFAKIEAVSIIVPGEDPQRATDRCKTVLSALTEELARTHFPTREQVRGE